MRIVESRCVGKSAAGNEDRLVITEHHVAVVDGASDHMQETIEGVSGGEWVAETVAEALKRLPERIDAEGAVEAATAAVAEGLSQLASHLSAAGARRPFCHLVVYSRHKNQVWRLGDCHVRVGETVMRGSKKVDEIAYSFRRAVNLAMLKEGADEEHIRAQDPGGQAAHALQSLQHNFQNLPPHEPLAYGCIDGTPVHPGHIETFDVKEGDEVVLASDGYDCITTDLAAAEESLAQDRHRDPLAVLEPMWRQGKPVRPGAEAADDRTWVRIAT